MVSGGEHIGFQVIAIGKHRVFRAFFRVAREQKRCFAIDKLKRKAGFVGVVRIGLFRRKDPKLGRVRKRELIVDIRADHRRFRVKAVVRDHVNKAVIRIHFGAVALDEKVFHREILNDGTGAAVMILMRMRENQIV